MINQRVITEKKRHREFLEVEVSRLWNFSQPNPERAKVAADMMYADILRISAEIIDLENGKSKDVTIGFHEYAKLASNYENTRRKLRAETDHDLRCATIYSANRWTLFVRWLKNTEKK